MTEIQKDLQQAILDYLEETPELVKTGEKGYGWSGEYDITKWAVSEKCKEKAQIIANKILGSPGGTGLIYRYATGKAFPHSIIAEHMLKKIKELKDESSKSIGQ